MLKQSSIALLLLGLMVCGIGCSDPSEGTVTEDSTTPPTPAPTVEESVVAAPDVQPSEPAVEVKSQPTKPAEEPAMSPSPAQPAIAAAKEPKSNEPPAVVAAPKVKFPEMKMSDRAAKIRALFIEANKQLKEERYVGAIQTLRKVDEMDLKEAEEKALDMFLERIDKAMNGDDAASQKKTDQ